MNKIDIHTDIIYNKWVKKDITIIHISDIHFNSRNKVKKLNKIKTEIIKQNPNYIIITGDTIDSPKETTKDSIKLLISFLKDLSTNYKIILSLGNHDIHNEEDIIFFNSLNQYNNINVLNNNCYKDEFIYIAGFTLPKNYYYNDQKNESKEILIAHLNNNQNLTKNLCLNIPKIGLIHSPIRLTDNKVLNLLQEYDLLLSGHTHGGLVPKILNKLFKANQGIISPRNHLFPKVARGKVEKNINNKIITIIINSGITKLGENSAGLLSKLNFIFNIDINKIILTNKEGK